MTQNQKLREAFEAYITDGGKWPNAIIKAPGGQYLLLRTSVAWQDWKACAEALALPTADHLPDAGKMLNGLTQAETDASASVSGLTAAPVGERLTLSAEDVHAAFVKHFPKTRISQAWIGFAAEIAEAIAARSAPSAGDAVDAQRTLLTVLQYNAISELCAIPPSLYESVVRAIERAHGIDAAMRKDKT